MLINEELLKSFKAPQSILDEIEFDEGEPYIVKIKTFDLNKEFPSYMVSNIEAFRELLRQKYGDDWIRNGNGHTQQVLGGLYFEFLKNSLEHGNEYNSDKYVFVGLWLGKNGLLLGFRDEGDFYKQPFTKETLENRKGFPSTRICDFGGIGTNCNLNETADDVFVDTETGTLYLSYMLKRKYRTMYDKGDE